MHDVSLVLASYGEPGRAVGVVGVLGPTRMAYRQAIGTVRFVSGLMNELVDHHLRMTATTDDATAGRSRMSQRTRAAGADRRDRHLADASCSRRSRR